MYWAELKTVHTAPWPHCPNKNVFSSRLNWPYDSPHSLRLGSRLFQTCGEWVCSFLTAHQQHGGKGSVTVDYLHTLLTIIIAVHRLIYRNTVQKLTAVDRGLVRVSTPPRGSLRVRSMKQCQFSHFHFKNATTNPNPTPTVGMSGLCARRILRRIGHPAQNLGSCAELRKIYQMAQKMRKLCWFLLTLHLQRLKLHKVHDSTCNTDTGWHLCTSQPLVTMHYQQSKTKCKLNSNSQLKWTDKPWYSGQYTGVTDNCTVENKRSK